MSIKKLIPIIASLIALAGYSYYESQIRISEPKQPEYHYQIHKENIDHAPDGSALISIKHTHQLDWGRYANQVDNFTFPFIYEIQLKSGQKFMDEIQVADHQEINSIIENRKPEQIKFAILKSQQPLNISSKFRLLQGITTNDSFINFGLVFFSKFFGVMRNLILIGLLTNTFDILFPLIIFSESFSLIGFWTKQKHLLESFYKQILDSNFDLFNLIRKSITTSPDLQAITPLQNYGYSSQIFFNISGEFIVTMALLIFTIVIKSLHIFAKIQKVRYISSKLRPIWNGYIFCIMPRISLFIGFQTRNIFQGRFIDVLNAIVAAALLAGLIYYFAQLIIFVKTINERVEYLQDTYLDIGLSRKLEFEKEFDFDCLHYSILHYPAMNYMRLLFFFIPIGASHDLHYFSIGFPIASQLFFIMINTSCCGYRKGRDKAIQIFTDLFTILIGLSLLVVGLAQSVNHSQVSLVAEVVFFSFALVNSVILTLMLLIDIYQYFISPNCFNKKKSKSENHNKPEKVYVRRKIAKKPAKSQDIETESDQSQSEKNSDSNTKQKSVKSSSDNSDQAIANNFEIPQTQVKKVKKGKLV